MKNICKSQNIEIADRTGGNTGTLIHKTQLEIKSTTKQWKYVKYDKKKKKQDETAEQLW